MCQVNPAWQADYVRCNRVPEAELVTTVRPVAPMAPRRAIIRVENPHGTLVHLPRMQCQAQIADSPVELQQHGIRDLAGVGGRVRKALHCLEWRVHGHVDSVERKVQVQAAGYVVLLDDIQRVSTQDSRVVRAIMRQVDVERPRAAAVCCGRGTADVVVRRDFPYFRAVVAVEMIPVVVSVAAAPAECRKSSPARRVLPQQPAQVPPVPPRASAR